MTGVLVDDSSPSEAARAAVVQNDQDREAATEENNQVSIDKDELQALIEQAVIKKVRPLEREIADLKETTRLHDILGGIGFIMGLAGITFYFLGVRKRDRMKSGKD